MTGSLSHGKQLDVGPVGLEQEQLPPWEAGALDLPGYFFPDRLHQPLELEIGSGKGTFLVHQAAQLPQVSFLGIEYAKAFWRFAADRCRRHGLTNVRLLHVEAAFFVRNYLPPASLQQVHIYFPDPWPKTRHNKRRLIQAPFLLELHRVLRPDGQIRIATDHSDYFQWIQEHAAQVADRFEVRPFESPLSAGEGELVGTNFERKYRREGRPFNALILAVRGKA